MIRKEALETAQFLNEHQDMFGLSSDTSSAVNVKPPQSNGGDSESIEEQTPDTSEEGTPNKPSRYTRFVNEVNADQELIDQHFVLDDATPALYLPDTQLLGDTREERQRRAALILLYLWETCFGEDRVKSSTLKDALVQSGIDDSSLTNAYRGDADRYFDRNGRGRSATIGLTGPGTREGYQEITGLVKQLQESTQAPTDEDLAQSEEARSDEQEPTGSGEEQAEDTKEIDGQSASLIDYE